MSLEDTRDGVFILLCNSDGKILLQKRSKNKQKFPSLWTWSVTGHLKEGENALDGALRELEEELGIRGIHLVKVGTFDRRDERYNLPESIDHKVTVFLGTWDGEIEHLDENEIEKVSWFSPKEALLSNRQTPSILQVFTYFFNEYLALNFGLR